MTSITRIPLEEITPTTVSNHGVICVDLGRQLSPDELVGIAKRLGRPQAFALQKYRPAHFPSEVTLIDNRGDGTTAAPRGFGEGWHQDSTYLPQPPEFTVLHSVEVPDSGGDTLFADTRPALQSLSAVELAQLSEMKLEHALRSTYRISPFDVGKSLADVVAGLPRTCHPVVTRHPRVGLTLCISPLYAAEQVETGMRDLFDRLVCEVVNGQVAHQWKAGELVVWDNRVVLHAATAYLGDERRCLMRSVVYDVGEAL
jgi:taurine dioxygenase